MVNQFILLIPAILVAITFHEYAHGWVALRLGDPTARAAGRLTLNPVSHLDPVGTLMFFLVHFGWARPVPVDPTYFRDPKQGMVRVAVAGPVINMVLAFLSGLAVTGLLVSGLGYTAGMAAVTTMLVLSLKINLALAVFNLLPIPPLDGSKVLYGLLPPRYEGIAHDVEMYGPWVLVGLIVLGRLSGVSVFWMFIGPFVNFFSSLFTFGLM
ncbi:MAG: site-2 protease family protein [Fidelibacterota bacterium]